MSSSSASQFWNSSAYSSWSIRQSAASFPGPGALALEFKLGGEVLRTVITRDRDELFILGAIILLRGVLTFLIHWEIKNEEKALAKSSADLLRKSSPGADRSGKKRLKKASSGPTVKNHKKE